MQLELGWRGHDPPELGFTKFFAGSLEQMFENNISTALN